MTEIIDYSDKFLNLVSICNAQHIRYCPCQNNLINEAMSKLIKEDVKYKTENNLDSIQSKHRNNYLKLKAIEHVGLELAEKGVKCSVEQDLIVNIVYKFDSVNGVGKYDINDSDVFLIFRVMLNHILSAHRLQIFSNKTGSVQKIVDKNGVEHFHVNPAEHTKLAFDKVMVDAVEKLNKIVYGSKNTNANINFNVSTEPLPITELFK